MADFDDIIFDKKALQDYYFSDTKSRGADLRQRTRGDGEHQPPGVALSTWQEVEEEEEGDEDEEKDGLTLLEVSNTRWVTFESGGITLIPDIIA